ncbi:MAG: hypothetical protein QF824_02710 [Candidatus Woesearchaeota archaeon]|jgi:hypothetical protein|nr:hypothetical protein [Candidatus Woesearchaeota archaeon]|tara:strand:- start:839 stop:1249 length:411 start_codon:yes stop_codon:yes gene_type:complete
MRIPKRYGQSRIDNCPFCEKVSTTKNKQGVPVCQNHKENVLKDLKCVCGEWLDLLEGKWGPYFKCINCGNINFNKGLELNPQIKDEESSDEDDDSNETPTTDETSTERETTNSSQKQTQYEHKPTETTVRSDELDF